MTKSIQSNINHFIACFSILSVTILPRNAFAQSNTANGVGSQFEMVFWQSVSESEDRAQLEAYLTQYPNGTFAALARAKIAAIDRRTPAVLAAPIAPPSGPVAVPVSRAVVIPPALPVLVAVPAPKTPATQIGSTGALPVEQPSSSSKAAPVVMDGSLAEQLRALSKTQGLAPAPSQASFAPAELPPRPTLASIPPSTLPTQFCSAVERNAYYDASYKPAMDLADQNNRTAIDHMKGLQQSYEAAAQRRDIAASNLFATEAKAYEAVAKEAYALRTTYDSEFNRLMAVPIATCTSAVK